MQLSLFESTAPQVTPFKSQLLKWIGNKQRFAHEIVNYFPKNIGVYYEPFVGSGAVLATLSPSQAFASDSFTPLIEIWDTLKKDPELLKTWYSERWHKIARLGKKEAYEEVKASFNKSPNGADLLFLCRSCYGGVVRFRKSDGFMSTPCGVHDPISPVSFGKRVDEWAWRVAGASFENVDFEHAFEYAKAGDLIYCDPPYTHSQTILYGAQGFDLMRLFSAIEKARCKGVSVVLSIDGLKKSGNQLCELPIPAGLFETEVFVNCGRSMLRRFQLGGETLEHEVVSDRLLLTYPLT